MNFRQIEKKLGNHQRHKKIVVAMASDPSTRGAVAHALEAGIADVIFVGARAEVEADEAIMRHPRHIEIVDADDVDDAAAKAVAIAREGRADVLMKGMLNTDNLLRAVLNKQTGILRPGEVLTHVTVAEIPAYPKLLLFTDAAVIPYPTNPQREAQLRYVLHLAREIGIEAPKVALVHCSEKVDERHFPYTADYVALRDAAKTGAYGDCVVDGPFDVKTCLSKAAMDKKHIVSDIDGQADAMIFPDIVSANTFYKTVTLFADATVAGLIMGCDVPVILPSRGDNADSKYHSLLIACSINDH